MFCRVKDERGKILRCSTDDQASDGGQGVVEPTSDKQEDKATKLIFFAAGQSKSLKIQGDPVLSFLWRECCRSSSTGTAVMVNQRKHKSR